jgi:uncharacterized protein YjbJ (UPF0337 family)
MVKPRLNFLPETKGGYTMGIGDKIQNQVEHLGGKAKEATGNATNNDQLRAEGQKDQVVADAKKVGEDVKDAFKKD